MVILEFHVDLSGCDMQGSGQEEGVMLVVFPKSWKMLATEIS